MAKDERNLSRLVRTLADPPQQRTNGPTQSRFSLVPEDQRTRPTPTSTNAPHDEHPQHEQQQPFTGQGVTGVLGNVFQNISRFFLGGEEHRADADGHEVRSGGGERQPPRRPVSPTVEEHADHPIGDDHQAAATASPARAADLPTPATENSALEGRTGNSRDGERSLSGTSANAGVQTPTNAATTDEQSSPSPRATNPTAPEQQESSLSATDEASAPHDADQEPHHPHPVYPTIIPAEHLERHARREAMLRDSERQRDQSADGSGAEHSLAE